MKTVGWEELNEITKNIKPEIYEVNNITFYIYQIDDNNYAMKDDAGAWKAIYRTAKEAKSDASMYERIRVPFKVFDF